MTETVKHTPERIWACMGGPMVGMFVSGGYTADWPQYVRADIADEMLEALRQMVVNSEADGKAYRDCHKKALAAIAKAAGGQP